MYSYGCAGTWLLSAILERCFDKPYCELLANELLGPLNISVTRRAAYDGADGSRICPALGEGLAIDGNDVLRFLAYRMSTGAENAVGLAPVLLGSESDITPLSAWSPLERGVRLGWKHYGAGWLGHNSVLPGAPTLLRVHARHRIGLLVTCTHHSPTSVATALLGKALPEYFSLQMPKLLTAAEAAQQDLSRYVGVYQNAATSIHVQLSEQNALRIQAFRRSEDPARRQPFSAARLRPARAEIFFAQPADPAFIPFVQFLSPLGQAFAYLWNGTALWPNVALEERTSLGALQ
jgi:hypothetical protein